MRFSISLISLVFVMGSTLCAQRLDLRDELQQYLTKHAAANWTARREKIGKLDSQTAISERQHYIRQWMRDAIGGLPEKTPLNPKITGGLQRDGYRVEHLVFESQPGFYVTANVYVPAGQGPFPAVLGVAGHSAAGKAINTYQMAWIGMVKRGFLVLAFDPAGQGERSEYFEPAAGKSKVGIGVPEHNMSGTQTLLTGIPYARYEIWDGMRAIDYLLTRKEVDPNRIAVAGNSGGGTQSAYLAVLETRLAAVVISCYMTDWEQLWAHPGPQDAEQNFPGFLSAGLNFGDFMISFAPKPITMLTGTRDFFPIVGARNTYAEVKRVFEAADAPGRAGFFEYDDEHGWHKPRREATYRWLEKWLHGKDDEGTEPLITPEPEKNLNVTRTGQVSTSLGGETVRSLNLKMAEKLAAARTPVTREVIARRLNVGARSGVPHVVMEGKSSLLIETEPGIHVYGRMNSPASAGRHPATLCIGSCTAQPERFMLSISPRGMGESAPVEKSSSGYTGAYQLAQRAMLIGKPLSGMQVFDVLRAFDYLVGLEDVDPSNIEVRGSGNAGVLALYVGALEPRIASVICEGALTSYMALARATMHRDMIGIVVPGVLKDFDLPDIASLIAPRPLRIVAPRNPDGSIAELAAVRQEYVSVAARYKQAGRPDGFELVQ